MQPTHPTSMARAARLAVRHLISDPTREAPRDGCQIGTPTSAEEPHFGAGDSRVGNHPHHARSHDVEKSATRVVEMRPMQTHVSHMPGNRLYPFPHFAKCPGLDWMPDLRHVDLILVAVFLILLVEMTYQEDKLCPERQDQLPWQVVELSVCDFYHHGCSVQAASVARAYERPLLAGQLAGQVFQAFLALTRRELPGELTCRQSHPR